MHPIAHSSPDKRLVLSSAPRSGEGALFQRLQDYQAYEPGGPSYAQLGDELGMTEAAIKSAVQRMRQRHRELLREEVAPPFEPDGRISHANPFAPVR